MTRTARCQQCYEPAPCLRCVAPIEPAPDPSWWLIAAGVVALAACVWGTWFGGWFNGL